MSLQRRRLTLVKAAGEEASNAAAAATAASSRGISFLQILFIVGLVVTAFAFSVASLVVSTTKTTTLPVVELSGNSCNCTNTTIINNITTTTIGGGYSGESTTFENITLNGALTCNNTNTNGLAAISDECLPVRVGRINMMGPDISNYNFAITGGPGIKVSGFGNSITISNNVNLTVVSDEYIVRLLYGHVTLSKTNQSANFVFAGPSSSPSFGGGGIPYFRRLVAADLPTIYLNDTSNAVVAGILPTHLGGTGVNGTYLLAGNGIGLTQLLNGTLVIEYTAGVIAHDEVVWVDLQVPTDIFRVTSSPVTFNGSHVFQVVDQAAHTVWAGPSGGSAIGPTTFRLLVEGDIPLLNASNRLYGVLPVSHGGTGSHAPLVGGILGAIMVPLDNQSIVQGSLNVAAGSGLLLVANARDMVIENVGLLHNVSLALPADLFVPVVNTVSGPSGGTLSFGKRTQGTNKVLAGPALGLTEQEPTFRLLQAEDIPTIDLTNAAGDVAGTLPIVHGGTNSNVALHGNRIMISSAAGGAIVEYPAPMPDGTLLIGNTNSTPSLNTIQGTGGVLVTNGPGTISLSLDLSFQTCPNPVSDTCIPSILNLQGLAVADSTLLGTNTSCKTPLMPSCYDISHQSCAAGPLSTNCMPANVHFQSITADFLTVFNGTQLSAGSYANNTVLNTLLLNGTTTCAPGITIDNACFELGGQTCAMGNPLSESCIPASLVMQHMTVLNNLTLNNVICLGPTFDNACLPTRIRSINNILPTSSPALDFSITSGNAGLTVNNQANGISLVNNALLSVTLAVPTSEFILTSSLATGNAGVLGFAKQEQAKNTIWAGPVMGASAQPTFRALDLRDLPRLLNGQLFIGDSNGGAVVNASLIGAGGITVTNGAGSITLTGSGGTVTSVSVSLPSSVFSTAVPSAITTNGTLAVSFLVQTRNRIFAGPVSGANAVPAFRSMDFYDLPPLLNGELYIGSTPDGSVVAGSLLADTGIAIVNSPGAIQISNTGVVSVSLLLPAAVFSQTTSTVNTNGTLTATLVSQAARSFFAGPASGTSAAPTFRTLEFSDLPLAGNLIGTNGITITHNGAGNITLSGSGGTLTSVGLSVEGSEWTVAASPVTGTNGTILLQKANQTANTFYAGPVETTSGAPTFRKLHISDLDSLNLTDGQLLIGSANGTLAASTLTAGSNVVITNGPGGITISASVNTSMIGTVMSVAATVPSTLFNLVGSPITSTGTLAFTLVNQSANTFFAGPTTGGGQPSFRSMVYADMPQLLQNQIYMGSAANLTDARTLAASGGLTLTVSNTTATFGTTGLLATVQAAQAAKTVFAGPTTGGATPPTFRSLVPSDLPALGDGQIYIGSGGMPVVSSLSAGSGISITPGMGSLVISSNLDPSTACFGDNSKLTLDERPDSSNFLLQYNENTKECSKIRISSIASGGTCFGQDETILQAESPRNSNLIHVYDENDKTCKKTAISSINHDELTNYVSSQHVDHSLVSIVAGDGLIGGGSIDATRTLSLNLNALLTDASPTISDFLVEYDVSAAAHRKISIGSLPIVLTASTITGTLPVARGGTNSATALNNNRIMISSGGAIVERAAMTNGQLLIGSTNAAPVAATLTGTTNQVTVSSGAGTITLSLPQSIHTAATPTFSTAFLSATTNQLRLGTTNTVTISATAPAASRTYTLHDAGAAAANFVLSSGGALTITNAPTTGQVLTATGTTTATWQTSSGGGGGALSHQTITATVTATTNSNSFLTMTSMTVTPAAGTYMVTFSGSCSSDNTDGVTSQYALYNDSTQITSSLMDFGNVSGSQANNFRMVCSTQAVITVNGSNVISVRWKSVPSGVFSVYTRSMILLKIN